MTEEQRAKNRRPVFFVRWNSWAYSRAFENPYCIVLVAREIEIEIERERGRDSESSGEGTRTRALTIVCVTRPTRMSMTSFAGSPQVYACESTVKLNFPRIGLLHTSNRSDGSLIRFVIVANVVISRASTRNVRRSKPKRFVRAIY